MKEIFSSGGGTQSAAIAALIVQGKLPRPDVVIIADTGFEKSTTWEYLDAVIRPELGKIGLDVHRVDHREWQSMRISKGTDVVSRCSPWRFALIAR